MRLSPNLADRHPQDVDTPTAPSNPRFAFGEMGGVFHATLGRLGAKRNSRHAPEQGDTLTKTDVRHGR